MVDVVSARLVKSFADSRAGFPVDQRPEAAFMGRSNVGKSSLINALLRMKNIARTSRTPGKTRLIHYYLINEAWHFVDLPGYGYARVSQSERHRWKLLVEGYLKKNDPPDVSLLLLDCRHRPTEADRQLQDWLSYHDLPYFVVLTKSDKLSRMRLLKSVKAVETDFLRGQDIQVIPFSARSGAGRDRLWKELRTRLLK